MNHREPLISIGLPVYNGEPYLRQALDSLLAQDYTNFELIISDNASTDDTKQTCLEYAERDARIQYYRNTQNIGSIPNFSRVLSLAKGEYFAWASHDDLWEPAYFGTMVRLLNDNPDAVLAFSAFDNIDALGRGIKTYPDLFDLPADNLFQRLDNYLRQEERLGKANPLYGLMRRKSIEEAGGCTSWGGGWGPDYLIVFRVLSLGKLVLAEELLFHKRLLSPFQGLPPARKTRFHPVFGTMAEQHEYFAGYRKLISLADKLTAREKIRLRKTVWRRLARFDWSCIRRTFVEPLPQRTHHFFSQVVQLSYGWLIRKPFLHKLARALKKSFARVKFRSGNST